MPTANKARLRTAIRLILLGWMIFIFALSSRQKLPSPLGLSPDLISVIGHFTVYFVLAVLLWSGLPCPGWSARRRLGLAFVGTMVFALSDEWHQSFVLGRESTMFDLAIDAVGALCALTVIELVARTRGSSVEDQRAGANRHQDSRSRTIDASALRVMTTPDGHRNCVAPVASGCSTGRDSENAWQAQGVLDGW
jgi:VanZ family protein